MKHSAHKVTSMALLNSPSTSNSRGVAVAEVLIVAVIITMIGGFVFVQFQKRQFQMSRSKAAEQLSIDFGNARLDSMRRGTRTIDQFAGVTMLDPVSYGVSQDSDSDGKLDQPQIVRIRVSGLKFGGPFPNTIKFDWLGRPVDTDGQIIEYPLFSVTDSSGSTFIKFTNTGKPVVSNTSKY